MTSIELTGFVLPGALFADRSPATARAPSLPMLLAELVALGREAWRVSERERAVRAEIESLREAEESEWPPEAGSGA